MRCFTLTTLLLMLPGCSYDNPLFGVEGETPSNSGGDTTAASAVTDEPVTTADPSVATSVTTSGEPGSTSVDPSDSTTSVEPGTTGAQSSSSAPGDSSTGIEPEPVCPLKNEAFSPYLLVNGQPLAQCPLAEIYVKGKLAVGDPLYIAASIECGAANNETWTLGTGLGLPAQAISKCLKTYLNLVDTADGCKINQIKTYDPADPNVVYLAASFSWSSNGLPFEPKAINYEYCGCADPNLDGTDCCAGLDPGELVLQPTNDNQIQLLQSHFATVQSANGQMFEFYNLQSWVGPGCMADPAADHHIDWIAVRSP